MEGGTGGPRSLSGIHFAKVFAGTPRISSRTAEFHEYQMMGALQIGNSAELSPFAIMQGMGTI